MSKWLNNKIVIEANKKLKRPCYSCGYCPYGQLVEEFPFTEGDTYSCDIFGHDCPMYYHAEFAKAESTRLRKKKK